MSGSYDLVVIGSGPAGEKGAAQAAYFGKKVALVEKEPHPGGAGINTGTVPSKTLRETALYFSGLRQRGLYGIDYCLKENLTMADFMRRQQAVVAHQHALIRRNLARHHIEWVNGQGSLVDAHTVKVHTTDGQVRYLEAEIILLATGSSPLRPPEVPFAQGRIYDSDSILHMAQIPRRLAVIGGGVIGAEYASLFAALGVQVMLVDGRTRLLPFVDAELTERLQEHLQHLGLQFFLGRQVRQITVTATAATVSLEDGEALIVDSVLYAAGRQSNVTGLGLEAVGVQTGPRGLVLVNAHYQTSQPNIYAAGDIIGFPALASTSMEQARVAMVHAFDLGYKTQIAPVVPLAVYTVPELALAGLTEADCQRQHIAYLVGRAYYERNARGQIIGDASGMLKLVFAAHDKRLLGVHLIGEQASELIHIGAQVLAQQGSIDAFIQAVYNYPSLSDSYKYAAYDGLGHWQAAQT